MSKTVHVNSASEFQSLIKSTKAVIVDFYADWCGPCKAIAPAFEQLSAKHSRPKLISFAKVNTDEQQEIVATYGISAMPTFILFENGQVSERVQGANPKAVQSLADKAVKVAGGASSGGEGSSDSGTWVGAPAARGYTDVTDQVDIRGLDLLNADSDFGTVRALFETGKPSSLGAGSKGKSKAAEGEPSKKDWVESDTDPQLMLYMPFQSTMKVHTLQITSLPPFSDDDDETPMRPKTIKLYTNRAHNLGFEEADDIPPTQTIELSSKDWNEETGTANVELRFVKFQNISSLVVFVEDGDGDGEKTRIDRLRIIGESGEKKSMGKLEKIGDEQGE